MCKNVCVVVCACVCVCAFVGRLEHRSQGSDTASVRSEGITHSEYSNIQGTGSGDSTESRRGGSRRASKEDEAEKKGARALAADPVKLQREKKKQARDLVYLSGLDEEVCQSALSPLSRWPFVCCMFTRVWGVGCLSRGSHSR